MAGDALYSLIPRSLAFQMYSMLIEVVAHGPNPAYMTLSSDPPDVTSVGG